jgi:hypothetical protein
MKLDKSLRRDRKRQRRHKMVVENKSIFTLEELINKNGKKKRKRIRK